MAVQLRFTQDPGGANEDVGTWGQAYLGSHGYDYDVDGQTTSETIASWRIEALLGYYDHGSDITLAEGETLTVDFAASTLTMT